VNESALEAARIAAGKPSYRTVERRLVALLGEHFTPTDQTISRYHQPGRCPRRPEPALILALCHLYGVDLADIAPDLVDDVDRVRELFTPARSASRCNSTSALALVA
jgi:hypothetical protein